MGRKTISNDTIRTTIFNEINMGMNLTAIKNEKSVLLCGNQPPFSNIIKMLQLFTLKKLLFHPVLL